MGALFDLERFVQAQADVYSTALDELRSGQKRSHWMWFIFPQLKGLGLSSTAQFFGLSGLDEATAYLNHPLLGPRLRECSEAILAVNGRSALQILGQPDDLKLHSSMTLFEQVAGPSTVFSAVLGKYFDGQPDRRTMDLLKDK